MSANDKWTMFKNYMHNELGITKEDIRQWIEDAVKIEAKKMVENAFKYFDPEKIVNDMVWSKAYWGDPKIKQEIKAEVGRILASQYKISLTREDDF